MLLKLFFMQFPITVCNGQPQATSAWVQCNIPAPPESRCCASLGNRRRSGMLRIADALAAAAIAALLTLPPGPAAGEVLHLTTEQYAPFNFDQDGEIKGLGADQVREIMRRSGIAYDKIGRAHV